MIAKYLYKKLRKDGEKRMAVKADFREAEADVVSVQGCL